MANMNFSTANPLGRWWHPLPLSSGIGALFGTVVLKSLGYLDEMSWGFVIAVPLILDIAVNALIIGAETLFYWIADKRDKARAQKGADGHTDDENHA